MLSKDSFIKFMDMAASVRETLAVYNSIHSTTLPHSDIYLVYKHSTFLRHRVVMVPWKTINTALRLHGFSVQSTMNRILNHVAFQVTLHYGPWFSPGSKIICGLA